MKKCILAWLFICSLLFSACSTETSKVAHVDNEIEFTDDLGRVVRVKEPQRTAAMLGSFAQIWQLAGGEVCATASDAWDDLGLTLAEDTVNLGGTVSQSLELLIGAKPDFILASTNTRQNLEWKDTLEAIGIPVAYFDVSDFEDYLRMLDICTDITGRKELYEENGSKVKEEIEEILERNHQYFSDREAPRILSMTASASFVKAKNSENNVLGTMLKNMGCVNIADSDKVLLENLSMEHILISDPDYIFIVQRGDNEEGMRQYVEQMLMEHPVWKQLTAVKNGRVYFMEKRLFSLKPNHQWAEAYRILEEILRND